MQVIALGAGEGQPTELLRCAACARTAWRSGGTLVSKSEALGAITESLASRAPGRPRPDRRERAPRATERATPPAGEDGRTLADMLAGWRVLGADS